MRPLIIDSPDLQTLRQRYAYAALTFVFWLTWFYFWIPLVSLVAWLLGGEIFYEHMVVLDGLAGLIDLLGWYLLVIFLIALAIGAWSRYNLMRFRGKGKRRPSAPVEPGALAEFYAVTPQQLAQSRGARRMIIRHDERGAIQAIEVL